MDINILITDETLNRVTSAEGADPSPNAQDDDTPFGSLFSECAAAVFEMFETDFESCEISLLLTGDERIRELNKEYRDKDYATDVLSFPMSEDPFAEGGMLGDIAISLDTAKEQADEAAIRIERELAFLFIHGLLHLLGYDHEQGPDEEEEMFDLQEEILRNLLEKGKVP